MKRTGPMLKIAAPMRVLAQRAAFLGLLGGAVGLMVLGKAEAPFVERARMLVADAVVPVLDGIARPVQTAAQIADNVRGLMDVNAENARLRAQNAMLLHWQQVARNLEAENRALRETVHAATEASFTYVTARVVADAGGAFVRSVLIAAGLRDGVAKGHTAMSPNGLAGRVGEVGERSARVLLLTDLNSHVPVMIESTRDRAILDGDNTDLPRLVFLASGSRPQLGDRIVTSGHGGVFPPGLPVGVVVQTGEQGGVRVKPFVDFHRIDYLRVVDYGTGGTLPLAAPPPQIKRLR
ncbi:MAG: rod shape-determining protein MreC [Rhodospirillales bacterium]|nr:rod shape-determining protein MreC [Rhodospirillales bacterium]